MGNSLAAVSLMASFVYALFLSALVAVSALPVGPNENPDGLSKHIADTLKGYSSQLGELQQNTEKLKTETDNKVKDAEMKVQETEKNSQQKLQEQERIAKENEDRIKKDTEDKLKQTDDQIKQETAQKIQLLRTARSNQRIRPAKQSRRPKT